MGSTTRRAQARLHGARRKLAAGVAAGVGLALVAAALTLAPAQAGPLDPLAPDTGTVLDDVVDTVVLDPGEVLNPDTGVVTDADGTVTRLIDPVTGIVTDPTGGLIGVLDPLTGALVVPPVPVIGPGGAGGSIEFLSQIGSVWTLLCSSDGTVAKTCSAVPLGSLTEDAALLLRAVPAADGQVPQWDPATCPEVVADVCMIPLADMVADTPLAPVVAFLPGGAADAPETTITSTTPSKSRTSHTFTFKAEPVTEDTRFECRLQVTYKGTPASGAQESHEWQPCADQQGSQRYENLANGTYVFTVKAIEGSGDAGVEDETPASQSWTVSLPPEVPETRIHAGPAANSWVLNNRVSYRFRSTVVPSEFECEFDQQPQGEVCDSGAWTSGRLTKGRHVFSVYARANKTQDFTPARRTFHVPLDDAALKPLKAWARKSGQKGRFRNTLSATTVQGAALVTKRQQKFRRIALVADKGPGHGTVKVFWNARMLKEVDLGAQRLQKRKVIPILRLSGGRLRQGTLRIVVTSRGKVVRIDGLGVANR